MGSDLDPLDEIFPGRAENNARAGGKFQPKAKARPRIDSIQAANMVEPQLTDLVGPSLASSKALHSKNPLITNEDSVSGVHSSDESALVNPSLGRFVMGETLGHNVGLQSEAVIPDIKGKPAGECMDVYYGLESLGDFPSQSKTATSRCSYKVDLSTQLVNECTVARPANSDAEASLVPSEMSTIHVSSTTIAEDGPLIPVVSPLDDSATMFQEAEVVPCLKALDNLFELTPPPGQRRGKFKPKPKVQFDREKSASHQNGVESIQCFQDAQSFPSDVFDFPSSRFGDSTFELPEIEEPMDLVETTSPDASIPERHLKAVSESLEKVVPHPTSTQVSEIAERSRRAIPTRTHDSLEQSEASRSTRQLRKRTISCALVDESGDEAHDDGNFSNKCPSESHIDDNGNDGGYQVANETQKGRVSRKSNKSGPQKEKPIRKRKKVDEVPEQATNDEADDDGNFSNRCPSKSLIEDNGNDGEYQVANGTQKGRLCRKSNNSGPQKEKPIRKRKNVDEVPEQVTKEPRKKFPHSTRRKKRQVDRYLLDTPEEDFQKLPIRDIILLAEHREQLSVKEGKTSEAPSANQSAGNCFTGYIEDDNLYSEQGGGSSHEQENPTIQECDTRTNYHSYMNKTPRSRWSKQDTELFYEGVQQFGSVISMIQQLFPGRTHKQVKLKYKKEERQHPLRLKEALSTRANNHSHFQLVIERLQQVAAERKQNSYIDDSIGLIDNEEEDDVSKPEQAEEGEVDVSKPEQAEEGEVDVSKPEQAEEGEAESMEPEAFEVESSVKSYNSEDDLRRWCQYKSEL